MTFGVTGAALGAVSTAAFAWKYSRSPHGNDISLSVNNYLLFINLTCFFKRRHKACNSGIMGLFGSQLDLYVLY